MPSTMPFTEINQDINKENIQQPSRKRRASEGALLKPKPMLAPPSWMMSNSSKVNIDGNNTEQQTNETHWKKLFMSLQQERVTAAERQLFSFMKESDKREDSLKNYIRHLESDLMEAKKSLEVSKNQATDLVELQDKLDEKANQLKVSENSLEAMSAEVEELKRKAETNDELTEQVEQKDAEIEMYQLLTATVISPCEDVENSIECCVTNNVTKIFTKFRLTTLDDVTMMRFEPIENPQPLPSFLHQAIEFEVADCPGLVQNILEGMYPD